MIQYQEHVSTRRTTQTEKIPNSPQVENSAGGFSWAVDKWTRLDRFLVLGNEGGSYYASERTLTKENAQSVLDCLQEDGPRTVARIREMSHSGRIPKNETAIFALAMAIGLGSPETKAVAEAAVPCVCRTATHLFSFIDAVKAFRGRGRRLKRAISEWYNGKSAEDLAYQLVKYRQRNGWTHRDVFRLFRPIASNPELHRLYRYVVDPEHVGERVVKRYQQPESTYFSVDETPLPPLVVSFEELQRAQTVQEVLSLLKREPKLSWEMIPSQFLGEKRVWQTLIPNLPMTAMIRNLGRMTANESLAPFSDELHMVVERLTDVERLKKTRIHPIALLGALTTYSTGSGARGSLSWSPISQVTNALDEAFYLSFENVEPTNKRWMLALDVSGSMTWGTLAGLPGVTPRVGSAAMAMITARTETRHLVTAFETTLRPFDISPRERLDDICRKADRLNFGGTDCALPMIHALERKLPIDVFVVYTDSETWAGDIHPAQALAEYRQRMGIGAKLIVVGMVANNFTIADPNDAGMLDVVGFDTAVPDIMRNFA